MFENLSLGDDLESVQALYPELDIDLAHLDRTSIPAIAYVWGHNNMEDRPFLHLFFVYVDEMWELRRIRSHYFYPDPIELEELTAAAKSKFGPPTAEQSISSDNPFFLEFHVLAWGDQETIDKANASDASSSLFMMTFRRMKGGILEVLHLTCPLIIDK